MSKKELRDQVVNTGTATATTAALAVATGGHPAAVVATVFSGIAAFVLRHALDWKANEVTRWWEQVRAGDDGDGGPVGVAFEQQLEERVDEPAVRETILRGVRAVIDVVDPAAIRPLARLTRLYTIERREPDSFFRGSVRLLVEANAGDLEQMVELLIWITTTMTEESATLVTGGHAAEEVRIEEHVGRDGYQSTASRRFSAAARAFQLLELGGFGRPVTYGGRLSTVVHLDELRRLRKLL